MRQLNPPEETAINDQIKNSEVIRVLSVDEAADYIGVSISMMHKLKKRIPILRMGRSIRFLQSDLNAYLISVREGVIE